MRAPGTPKEISGWTLLVAWLAILALGAFSLVMRYSHIGSFSFLTGFGVAVVQASLIALFFMELIHEKPTVRFAFVTCLSLFALLVTFVVADVITRAIPPMQDPPGTAPRYHG
jgi:caa(3)-type oxidase subunit IV